MIEVKGYKCEYCEKLYGNEPDAISCEQKHIIVINTEGLYEEQDTFPHELIVTFSNGEKAYYDYAAHVMK